MDLASEFPIACLRYGLSSRALPNIFASIQLDDLNWKMAELYLSSVQELPGQVVSRLDSSKDCHRTRNGNAKQTYVSVNHM